MRCANCLHYASARDPRLPLDLPRLSAAKSYLNPPQVRGGLERSHSRILSRYLRSPWFTLDVISVIPFDLLAIYGILGRIGLDEENMSKAMLRLPRVQKLSKKH